MAVTAGGTPYVESSDLVANYPAVSLALAEHIDDLPAAILQVVRATDSTDRTTTSTSFVDANISVTITPQKNTSAILLIWSGVAGDLSAATYIDMQITDSSNNAISGAEKARFGSNVSGTLYTPVVIVGYATPATTSATTYKGRFAATTANTMGIYNSTYSTGQMYAIEVSA